MCEVNPLTVRERRVGSRENAEETEREEQTREPCEGCFHVAKVVDSGARNNTRAVGRELPLPHRMDWNFVLTLKTDRRKFPT